MNREFLRANTPLIEKVSKYAAQVTLAIIFLSFGFVKFAEYEAQAIQGLVANFPLTSWMYNFWSMQAVSNIFGIIEIATGILILIGLRVAVASALGSLMAIVAFIITLSFMFFVSIVQEGMFFPYLSPFPGQFLLKDLGLIALSVIVFKDALKRLLN